MVTVTGLGSFREVGRSAILVEGGDSLLMDYGLNVQKMEVPLKPPVRLDGILLSHAHLDHCGVIPELYKRGFLGSVHAHPATLDLIRLMLEDALKVQARKKITSYYHPHDIEKMDELSSPVPFGKTVQFPHSQATFVHAGHVPGSAMILVEIDGKRILYTGDVKFIDTELMRRAATDFRDIDLLICESTYPGKDHPDRGQLKQELHRHVRDVVSNNGTVVLPCFAIGRTQELLQVLSELDLPLHLDGMGAKVTAIVLRYPEAVRDIRALRRAFSRARKVTSHPQRFKVLSHPGAILTTAGMLNGGPVTHYIRQLHAKETCSLYISGYQVEGTVGATLRDTGRYVNEGMDIQPKMQVLFRDWSAHCGRSEILNFIRKIRPKKTIFNHGGQCEEFAREVSGMGFPAFAPPNGEKFEV